MPTGQLSRKSLQLNGITTTYLDSGQGEPIVALHGIPTSSLLFAPLVPFLRNSRLIAPDLLGQGQTEAPPTGPLGYTAYADHLRAFMNSVPPQRFYLLVHDLGGVLGLDWATESVDRLESLIILSTTVTESFRVGKALYAANLILGQGVLRRGMQSTLKRPQTLDSALLEEWAKPWSRRRILRGTDHFASHHLQRIRLKLGRIQAPVLVIWGEQDNIFPLQHASSIVQALPQAKMSNHQTMWSLVAARRTRRSCTIHDEVFQRKRLCVNRACAQLRSLRHEDVAVMLLRETSLAGLPAVSYLPMRHRQR